MKSKLPLSLATLLTCLVLLVSAQDDAAPATTTTTVSPETESTYSPASKPLVKVEVNLPKKDNNASGEETGGKNEESSNDNKDSVNKTIVYVVHHSGPYLPPAEQIPKLISELERQQAEQAKQVKKYDPLGDFSDEQKKRQYHQDMLVTQLAQFEELLEPMVKQEANITQKNDMEEVLGGVSELRKLIEAHQLFNISKVMTQWKQGKLSESSSSSSNAANAEPNPEEPNEPSPVQSQPPPGQEEKPEEVSSGHDENKPAIRTIFLVTSQQGAPAQAQPPKPQHIVGSSQIPAHLFGHPQTLASIPYGTQYAAPSNSLYKPLYRPQPSLLAHHGHFHRRFLVPSYGTRRLPALQEAYYNPASAGGGGSDESSGDQPQLPYGSVMRGPGGYY